MASKIATMEIELALPSCTLMRKDLVEIARRMCGAITSDRCKASFQIKGHDFSLSTKSAENLDALDWPERIDSISFNAESWGEDRRSISFRISHWLFLNGTMSISGVDAIWVRGTVADFHAFFRRHRNYHSLLNNFFARTAIGFLAWAVIFVAVALAVYANDRDAFSAASAEDFAPAAILLLWFLGVSNWLMAAILPTIEHEGSIGPVARVLRRLLPAALGALVLNLLSDFIFAGILFLG